MAGRRCADKGLGCWHLLLLGRIAGRVFGIEFDKGLNRVGFVV